MDVVDEAGEAWMRRGLYVLNSQIGEIWWMIICLGFGVCYHDVVGKA